MLVFTIYAFRCVMENHIISKGVSWGFYRKCLEALPNPIETFTAHFVYFFIAYKRKDITIPIALHYAYNFLGGII